MSNQKMKMMIHLHYFKFFLSYSSTSHKDQVSNVEENEESILQPANDSSSTFIQDASSQLKIHNAIVKDHPIDQIVGDINKGVQTRSRLASFFNITPLFLVVTN
jgi:hypothetical protein